MNITDERILELLASAEHDEMLSPSELAESGYINSSASYVGQRLRRLLETGLIYRRKPGYYAITDEGRDYLDGRKDMRDVEEPV